MFLFPDVTWNCDVTRNCGWPLPLSRITALSILFVTALHAPPAAAHANERPNIVVIMADDLGFSDVGCYGGEIETPNIDRLAARGLRFTQFYNCAVCGTTRASLLTGLYHHQLGIRNWTGTINDNGVLFTELLSAAGYHTMMVGKWDGSVPAEKRGIDRFFGFNTLGPVSYFNEVVSSPFYLNGQRWKVPDEGFFITDALTDYAVKFVEEAATLDKPFFLYSANIAPHWPLHAPEDEIAKYRERYRKAGWDTLRKQRYRRQVEMGLIDAKYALAPRDAKIPAWESVKHKDWQAERMAAYAAQIDRLDQNIGRILKAIEKAGAWDNTVIMFLSDNGPSDQQGYNRPETLNNYRGRGLWRTDGTKMIAGNQPSIRPGVEGHFTCYGPEWANVSNVPFRQYKIRSHEGGIATPLIVHWPAKIKKAGITHEVGHVMDIAATCLDLAGAEYPRQWKGKPRLPLEGKTLRPIFETGTRQGHDELFWEFAGHRAVRMGQWKLVALKGKPWELYNLEADRTELHDLIDAQAQRADEMKTAWNAWAKRVGIQK